MEINDVILICIKLIFFFMFLSISLRGYCLFLKDVVELRIIWIL